jgi:hypothetical protein
VTEFDDVVRILTYVKVYCVEWNQSHIIEDVSALSGEFSLNLGLSDFFFELLSIAVGFLKIPLSVLAERLQLFESLPIIARSVTAIAGLDSFATSAFSRCAEDHIELGCCLRKPRHHFAVLGEWYHQRSVILAISHDCSPFVSHAIKVFGADK